MLHASFFYPSKPGVLLPTAHAIEREFKIMKALESSDVPVPKMISFCSDDRYDD